MELTILMPCLNEEKTIRQCIEKAKTFLSQNAVKGEVIVADNGSTDGSQEIAIQAGARVVDVSKKGYGAAIIGGIQSASGKYIIFGDADDSYNFLKLELYLSSLRNGAELVIGNRFKGGIENGAMPFLHRYLGTPVISFIGRLFFQLKLGDFNCGLRGIRRESAEKLNLRCSGMEFASEMLVKSALQRMEIREVPTTLQKDGRERAPHLRTWKDGWRHLKFLLMLSPRWLFLIPGLAMWIMGTCSWITLAYGPQKIGNFMLDIHSMLYAGAASVVGLQLVYFAVFTRLLGIWFGALPKHKTLETKLEKFYLEHGLLLGIAAVVMGFALIGVSVWEWSKGQYSYADPEKLMRIAVPASVLVIQGATTIFASFFVSIIREFNNQKRVK